MKISWETRADISDETSDWVHVTNSVSQGSVLGPLSFIIHVNDLDLNILNKTDKFANDNKLGHKSEHNLGHDIIQQDLNEPFNWW